MRQETDKQPEQQSKKEYRVFFTHDTVRGIMLEVARHPKLESIIQMPGIRIGNDFFYDGVADSGMNATYRYGMVEKDHEYCDHLSTRIAEYYVIPNEELTVAQFHRHPRGYSRFSLGDRPANTKLARQFGGVICGLMLIDPEFTIRCWYIDENGEEMPVSYCVDDAAVRAAMPKKSLHALKRMIEKNEGTAVVSRRSDNTVVRSF